MGNGAHRCSAGIDGRMVITRSHSRRGSMYIMVLGCTTAIAVIGLSVLTALRIQRRGAEGTIDFAQARLYAQSAIEVGLLRIENDADWRATYPNGIWEEDQAIGTGRYTLEGIDPVDGDLTNNELDPVVLTGMGYEGDARYKLQVTLTADAGPLSCLEASLHAGGNLVFDASVGSITADGDQIFSANNMMTALTGGTTTVIVNPDMEAVNGFSGTFGPGTTTSGITPRDMPDQAKVFEYWVDKATPIDWFSLPDAGTTGEVRKVYQVVLSPASNPFGPTDPEGVYTIDCQGLELSISESRIVGTLVITNARTTSLVSGSVNWEPAVANYPVLLMQGSMRWWQSPDALI